MCDQAACWPGSNTASIQRLSMTIKHGEGSWDFSISHTLFKLATTVADQNK